MTGKIYTRMSQTKSSKVLDYLYKYGVNREIGLNMLMEKTFKEYDKNFCMQLAKLEKYGLVKRRLEKIPNIKGVPRLFVKLTPRGAEKIEHRRRMVELESQY